MAWNKGTMGRWLVGALAIGSAPGGRRSVGLTAVATPNGTSPTVIYNFIAPTFALSSALITAATNVNAATIAIQSSGDITLPFIGISLGDDIDVSPQFAPPAGVSWAGYTMLATGLTGRANTTAYIAGQVVKVTVASVVTAFACTTAGTTAGAPPAFSATLGTTTTDGTAVWTCLGTSVAQLRITNATVGAITVAGNLNGNWGATWMGFGA